MAATESFSGMLRRLRRARGWSQARLAEALCELSGRSTVTRQEVYRWERGTRVPTFWLPYIARVLDISRETLEYTLVEADSGSRLNQVREGEGVNRRELLYDFGALAPVPVLTGVEALRHELHAALGRTADMWEHAAAEYARAFYTTAPVILLRDLLADLGVLGQQLRSASGIRFVELSRAIGQIAAVTALTWTTLGERQQAARWWSTARGAADSSTDPVVRVWVRAWEVCNGPYVDRPPAETFALAAEAIDIAEDRIDVGTAGLYAGLAQAQAAVGHPEALATLRRAGEVTERLPAKVMDDRDSLFGWPEVRLRFTESFVHTARGDTASGYTAQETALALYGQTLPSDRVKVELHRSKCLIIDGDVSGGISATHQALDWYPISGKGSVWSLAREVLDIIPDQSRRNPAVGALRERLAITA